MSAVVGMSRAGLILVLVISAGTGLACGVFPSIDLWIAGKFYDAVNVQHNQPALHLSSAVLWLRRAAILVEILLVAPAVVAFGLKLVLPRSRLLISGSAIVFLISTMALGPGLLVNIALKDHWGRPRPGRIVEFGGDQHFVAWWNPRGDCVKNCSFVSGEVSSAFWTVAPAALAPPAWRVLAYGAALTFGVAVALLRMVTGGHFLSDTIFAGVFTFLIVWLMYALIFRWNRTRLNDEALERALERFSLGVSGAARRLFHRAADQTASTADGETNRCMRS